MTIHSLHIFDRRGKTLFTKRYTEDSTSEQQQQMQQLLQQQQDHHPSASELSNVPQLSHDSSEGGDYDDYDDEEHLAEQRKLIFGMLFSLRELVASLVPEGEPGGLHSIRTGATTLHNYETLSGLRFAMYTSNDAVTTSNRNNNNNNANNNKSIDSSTVRKILKHIYAELWLDCVVRSPLYQPSTKGDSNFDIGCTNFEKKLDEYLMTLTWFQ